MVQKHLIRPQRIRKPPKTFSWLDHRLIRDQYLDQCSHPAAALYLFLVTVADARGLSYYSDRTISQRLHMDASMLREARSALIHIDLIAYQKPLYQVLALVDHCPATATRSSGLHSLKQIFKQIGEDAS